MEAFESLFGAMLGGWRPAEGSMPMGYALKSACLLVKASILLMALHTYSSWDLQQTGLEMCAGPLMYSQEVKECKMVEMHIHIQCKDWKKLGGNIDVPPYTFYECDFLWP